MGSEYTCCGHWREGPGRGFAEMAQWRGSSAGSGSGGTWPAAGGGALLGSLEDKPGDTHRSRWPREALKAFETTFHPINGRRIYRRLIWPRQAGGGPRASSTVVGVPCDPMSLLLVTARLEGNFGS